MKNKIFKEIVEAWKIGFIALIIIAIVLTPIILVGFHIVNNGIPETALKIIIIVMCFVSIPLIMGLSILSDI